jgi:hypothetical protein
LPVLKITKIAVVGVVVAASTAIGAAPAVASTMTSASHCPAWDKVQPQAPAQSTLLGVTALPSCAAWAVGTNSNPEPVAMNQQFSGTSWTKQTSPVTSAGSNLSAVAAVSDTSAWAVGSQGGRALIEHWDGKSWRTQAAPQPGGKGFTGLFGVAASSASDVWAVGNYGTTAPHHHTLIVHWNGKTWKQVPSPDPSGASHDSRLTSVTVVSAKNAWAVGYYHGAKHFRQTLILHWNGKSWQQVASPNPGQSHNALLFGVTALKTGRAWAVGYLLEGSNRLTLFLQWDRHHWTQIASPNPTPLGSNQMLSVAATSASNVWAVGWNALAGNNPVGLILHWNGQQWTQYPVPEPTAGTVQTLLFHVATSATGNAWAVGQYVDNGARGLAVHWDGHNWQS